MQEIIKCVSAAGERLDICADCASMGLISNSEPLIQICRELVQKEVKVQILTEIKKENVQYCRQLMTFAQLVHKDNVMEGIWVVTEKDFISTLPQDSKEGAFQQAPPYIQSNVKEVLILQKFVFDRLWARAIPAEIKIHELESGNIEKTEVFYGPENAVRIIVDSMAGVEREMIACTEAASIALVTNVEPIGREYKDFKRRGVRFRSIYEITKESLPYVKELVQYAEIRHLDGIKGNFAVTEKEYLATAIVTRGDEPVTEVIRSTSKAVMEQHRYFFESLWTRSVPAEQKIRELENGIQIPRIEVIEDPKKSIGVAVNIMEHTQKEFQVMYATPHTFALAVQIGALDLYNKMGYKGVVVKILVPSGPDDASLNRVVDHALKVAPSVRLRITPTELNTRITIMISDRHQVMTWELKDDSNQDPYQAAGVATYCNMESISTSYMTIFEALWNMAEMYEQVERHDKAQSEFINIAAHELRTPIQPILGLAEVLKEQVAGDSEHATLVDAIIRNARRLQGLQEDILEVARIESNLLNLKLARLNIDDTIARIVDEARSNMGIEKDVTLVLNGSTTGDVIVYADEERIAQVVRNLLENALKFTAEGTIRISTKMAKSGREAIVSVEDSGTGIDEEILPRLFQKFATKSPKGTGLGLFICRKIVESHGGRVWAENNSSGRGATFSFSLPTKPQR
jgi:signal transduction histidine kinase